MDMSPTEILQTLEPVLLEAEESGLWFYNQRHDIWFTPSELRTENAQGKYIWGPVNWQLIDPNKKVQQLEKQREYIGRQIIEWNEKIAANSK